MHKVSPENLPMAGGGDLSLQNHGSFRKPESSVFMLSINPFFFFLTFAFLQQLQQMSEGCDGSGRKETGVPNLLSSL